MCVCEINPEVELKSDPAFVRQDVVADKDKTASLSHTPPSHTHTHSTHSLSDTHSPTITTHLKEKLCHTHTHSALSDVLSLSLRWRLPVSLALIDEA